MRLRVAGRRLELLAAQSRGVGLAGAPWGHREAVGVARRPGRQRDAAAGPWPGGALGRQRDAVTAAGPEDRPVAAEGGQPRAEVARLPVGALDGPVGEQVAPRLVAAHLAAAEVRWVARSGSVGDRTLACRRRRVSP